MAKNLRTNSTQRFIEVTDVIEDVVILSGGNACVIIEVLATNFELLSAEEQDAKIFAYSNLLNSLSFYIQILIRSKKIDISSYVNSLEFEANKTRNSLLAKNIRLYKDFVANLVKVNTILEKKFYIIIPYSSLEKGAVGVAQTTGKSQTDIFFEEAKASLYSKAGNILNQLQRTGLKAQRLEREKIIRLFYDIFNDGELDALHNLNTHPPIVQGKEAAGPETSPARRTK